jgi:hypothetical protein
MKRRGSKRARNEHTDIIHQRPKPRKTSSTSLGKSYFETVVVPAQKNAAGKEFSAILDPTLSCFRDPQFSDKRFAHQQAKSQWMSNKHFGTSRERARSIRSKLYSSYVVHETIRHWVEDESFVFVDQGGPGPCSLAAMTNLCQLGGVVESWESICGAELVIMATKEGVRSIYSDHFGFDVSGYNTWKSAIERMERGCPGMTRLFHHFEYRIFRGRGDRMAEDLKQASAPDYAANVTGWIDSKLRSGYAVAVPFANHFCVIIGTSRSGYLFLGSYGDQGVWSDKGGLHELHFPKSALGDCVNDCLLIKVQVPPP